VAGEVKTLATQTAKATGEISQQIANLRGATDSAVATVEDISHTLERMAEVTVSVTAAVDQQTAATQEIARNVAESGAAVQEVTRRIAEVSADANVTGSQAAELRRSSGAVAVDIAALRSALVKTVRTASDDANRRLDKRISVDEPCTVVVDAGGGRVQARLRDVSNGGAAILVMDSGGTASGGGTLTLDRHAGAQTRFEIRSADASGKLHVQFDRASMNAALKQALHAMVGDIEADDAADASARVG